MPLIREDERELEDEHELDPTRSEVDKLDEENEEEVVVADAAALEVMHFEAVAVRVKAILDGHEIADRIDETAPELSEDERIAIRLLEEAVQGHEIASWHTVLAEDRMQMLELALATLQPALAVAFLPGLTGLRAQYEDLVDEVAELREKLDHLDAAQEELTAYRFEHEEAGESDEEDKPGDGAKPGEPKKPGVLSRIFGRKPKEEAATPPAADTGTDDAPRESTLFGKPNEPPVEDKEAPSTLFGKASEPAVEKPAAPSTLFGKPNEPAVEDKEAPSTLFGKPNEPAVEQPPSKSTVYEPE